MDRNIIFGSKPSTSTCAKSEVRKIRAKNAKLRCLALAAGLQDERILECSHSLGCALHIHLVVTTPVQRRCARFNARQRCAQSAEVYHDHKLPLE
jgi:hypothetical protein